MNKLLVQSLYNMVAGQLRSVSTDELLAMLRMVDDVIDARLANDPDAYLRAIIALPIDPEYRKMLAMLLWPAD